MIKFRVLSITFRILAILGATYVFYTDGKANAGFAIIPILISIVFKRLDGLSSNKAKQI